MSPALWTCRWTVALLNLFTNETQQWLTLAYTLYFCGGVVSELEYGLVYLETTHNEWILSSSIKTNADNFSIIQLSPLFQIPQMSPGDECTF